MLYRKKYCTIIKPIHYHFLSDFSIDPSILHALLQPGKHILKIFPLEAQRNSCKITLNTWLNYILGFDWYVSSLANAIRINYMQ
jgi:hypothetical protein